MWFPSKYKTAVFFIFPFISCELKWLANEIAVVTALFLCWKKKSPIKIVAFEIASDSRRARYFIIFHCIAATNYDQRSIVLWNAIENWLLFISFICDGACVLETKDSLASDRLNVLRSTVVRSGGGTGERMFGANESMRGTFLDKTKAAREERALEKRRDNAVIVIQSLIRGWLTRIKYERRIL